MIKEIDEKNIGTKQLVCSFMGGKPVGNGFEFMNPPTRMMIADYII